MTAGKLWETRWRQLSPRARAALLNDIKAPANPASTRPPSIIAARLPDAVVDELTAAGVVERQPGASPKLPERLIVPPVAVAFVQRIQELATWHPLAQERPEWLLGYVQRSFLSATLDRDLRPVFQQAGEDAFVSRGILLTQYVVSREWPAWVAQSLKQPLAEAILRAIEEAGGVVSLDELPGLLPDVSPLKVRLVVDALVARLALFEDLQPGTLDMMFGLLLPVREALRRAREPQARPALQPCPETSDLLPEGGYEVSDIRGFLVELASAPARLRQNLTLYQKETERFAAAIEPLPAWTASLLPALSDERRLQQASRWCAVLGLTRSVDRDGATWLELTREGQQWLAGDLAGQYRRLFAHLRTDQDDQTGHYSPYQGDFIFLGAGISAFEGKEKRKGWWAEMTATDRDRLRESFYAAFKDLPPGKFFRLNSVLAHATFGVHNPLTLGGLDAQRVTVRFDGVVPPLAEAREAAGRRSLELLITGRLLPLGCLQAGIDGEGWLCIARHARLDAYFGQPVADEALAGTPMAGARVLVQPDFSVIILGTMPAAAAELAPFCERSGGRGAAGTLQMKITREAVVGAVAGGLTGKEIEDRLTRHSSVPVPANVLHEVREWAGWVRTAEATPLVVLRCPDRATADRVASALGKQAERLTDTVVAVPAGALGSAERNKLKHHGILVRATKAAPATRGKKHR